MKGLDFSDADLVDDGQCFACGKDNEFGLQLHFQMDPERKIAVAYKTLDKRFGGWGEAVHGGIVCTMLDEAFVYAAVNTGKYTATATLTVKYRHPVPVNQELIVVGKLEKVRSSRVVAKSAVYLANGGSPILLAQAESIMMSLLAIPEADVAKYQRRGIPEIDSALLEF